MGKERNVPWEEILRRRKEGETARALAEEFGVSVESVYKRGQRERRAQRGSLQQAARNLCRSAGSMVAQMEDMDAKELKELTALLRDEGVAALKAAKTSHDALEAVYNPYVDFEGVRAQAALEAGRLLSWMK